MGVMRDLFGCKRRSFIQFALAVARAAGFAQEAEFAEVAIGQARGDARGGCRQFLQIAVGGADGEDGRAAGEIAVIDQLEELLLGPNRAGLGAQVIDLKRLHDAVVQKIDSVIDCNGICDRYQSCFDKDYDTSACAAKCRKAATRD